MSYQEVHLPLSPTQTPYLSLSRNSTYNAFINRKLQSRAPLYHDPSEEEHPHQSFWTRNVTYYSSISKDDMLRVLKGKNYRLSTSSNLKVSAANISIKDTRTILKSMTVNTESNCLRRMKR